MHHSLRIALLLLFCAASIMMSSRPTRVVFFGDSITELGAGPEGYISLLRGMLAPPGTGDPFELVGAGVGGNKVYDLYLRMDADVLARSPDVVVVFVGVNDVWHKRLFGTGTDPDKFVKFYEAIVTRLLGKNIRVVVTTPACVGEKPAQANDLDAELDQYAQLIRDIAGRYKLGVVDLRSAFQNYETQNNPERVDKGILTVDGVHFNRAGNKLAAELFAKALTGK